MNDFITASTEELYDRMALWNDLRGNISYDESADRIVWIIADDLKLHIILDDREGYIAVFDSLQINKTPLTHWHQELEDVYEILSDINSGKIKFGYINTLFGKEIVYIGIVSPNKKKRHRFRLIRYLGEQNDK